MEARPSGAAAPAPKGRALTPAMEDSRRTLSHRASAREGEREREGEEGRERESEREGVKRAPSRSSADGGAVAEARSPGAAVPHAAQP